MTRTYPTLRERLVPPLLWLLLLVTSANAGAREGESAPPQTLPALIQEVAEVLRLRATQAHPGAAVTADVLPLDTRLNLQPCTDADIAPRGTQTHGRIPVSVRCRAPKPWAIFMTGSVTVMLPVVVTRQPVSRGEILTSDMLATEPQDLAGLRNHFHTDRAQVLGKAAKRNLPAGSVIFASQIKQPLAVVRGQRVQIQARRGAVQINSQGEALENGSVGAQIRVKNLKSERIIYAWVEGPGRVSTGGGGTRPAVTQR